VVALSRRNSYVGFTCVKQTGWLSVLEKMAFDIVVVARFALRTLEEIAMLALKC
jgi:hypothetical protein